MCDRLKMGRRVENVDNVEKMQKIEKKSKKAVDIFINLYYTYVRNRDEAWLSLVERCVRDAEVASSNLVASIPACWSSGQDDALSRRKPGFDSRTGHDLNRLSEIQIAGFLFPVSCRAGPPSESPAPTPVL